LICYTSHITIKNSTLKDNVSKGITLSSENNDSKPSIQFNNLKIYPTLKLLYQLNSKYNTDRIYKPIFYYNNHYVIEDISLVLTTKKDILFDEPIDKDKNNMLLYLVIVDQDRSEVKPIKANKEECKLIYQSINKDTDNAIIKKYLYKFMKNNSQLEIETGFMKNNNMIYLWKNKSIYTGSKFHIDKLIKEEESIDKYL
jgi:hypothetical protein